jgi:hypothetical protein
LAVVVEHHTLLSLQTLVALVVELVMVILELLVEMELLGRGMLVVLLDHMERLRVVLEVGAVLVLLVLMLQLMTVVMAELDSIAVYQLEQT